MMGKIDIKITLPSDLLNQFDEFMNQKDTSAGQKLSETL